MPDRNYISIGVFDGVHLGHQQLLGSMVAAAREADARSMCITFDPHPDSLFNPDHVSQAICSLEDRIGRIASVGVDQVEVLEFTRDLAQQSAEDFVDRVDREFGLGMLWAGADFALGRGRTGTLSELARMGEKRGFSVHRVEPTRVDGRVISSTWVRELVLAGDMRAAHGLLGRDFVLEGPVIRGAQRGRELGFPTINLAPPVGRILPQDGVYAVQVEVAGHWVDGAASFGPRLTFDDDQRLLEVHLLDFDQDVYGQEVRVTFVEYLRGLLRFESLDALKDAISDDIRRTRLLLSQRITPTVGAAG